MNETTITETCGCGATFTTTAAYADLTRTAAREWREGHRHAESVGICGDRPAGWTAHSPAPYCVLKAEHAGMHAGDDGMSWAYTDTPDDDAQEGAQ